MDNVILNLFALLSFIIVIKYIWYPIMLSAFRDKMFSIRLSYRDYFYNKNLDTENTSYTSTYDYINNIIRYVEDYSFVDMLYKLYLLNKHKDILKDIENNINNDLQELSSEDREFVINIRKEISDYLLLHIIRTSFIAIFLMIIMIIYIVFISIFKRPKKIYIPSEQLSYIVSN